ncbi:hypothetical protein A2U01_0099782, partial [Trifolium medium]|nr:hypothetical protein [Trifolium medium]
MVENHKMDSGVGYARG